METYPAEYVVGLDLAQQSDYTALCVLEESLWAEDERLHRQFAIEGTAGSRLNRSYGHR